METTNSLISNLVQTKSIGKVLAPIANQVSQLILVNEAYENGEKEGFPDDLGANAEHVRKSADGLVMAASRLASESQDDDLRKDMPNACEMLTAAGENFVFATQNAQVNNFNEKSRKHLIRAAKDVLEGTLKVLMTSDDSEIRKIVRSARWVLDRLAIITGVSTQGELVPVFKSFAESTLILTTLANRRQADLSNPSQREALIDALSTLRKSVPLLSAAMQTYVRFPDNTQAKASKDYAVGQIAECLCAIINVVQNKQQDEDALDLEEPGKFIVAIDKLLDCLHEDKRSDLLSGGHELEVHMEIVLRHSMAVAHTADEKQRSLITKISQRTLQQKNTVLKAASSLKDDRLNKDFSDGVDEACDKMVIEITELENHVNRAVLQFIVATFRETIEPLERTVKAALKPRMAGEIKNDTEAERVMEPFIEVFYSHSDALTQAAAFLCAGSPDARRVRQIRGCLKHLQSLDPELVPAITASCRHLEDHAAIQHLKMLKDEWAKTIELLVSNIDGMIDSSEYINIAVTIMAEDVARLKDSQFCDAIKIVERSRLVVGGGLRISQVATQVIDNHTDAIFRNGVAVHINQLKKVLQAVKSSVSKVINDLGNLGLHEILHKRLDLLMKCLGNVKDSLKGQGHPDLMSDLRTTARTMAAKLNFDDEEDEDVEGFFTEKHQGRKLPVQRQESKKVSSANKSAVKNYLADLVSSNLKDLMRSLETAAVAGQQQEVSMLSNDVLAYSNHFTDSANRIALFCSNEQNLRDASRRVFSVTPQLLDKAQKVCDMDTYQIDALHATGQQWAERMSYLENLVDGQITKWKVVSDKVVDAALMCNARLLAAQTKYLQEHQRKVATLVAIVIENSCHGNAVVKARRLELEDLKEEVDNQSTVLLSLADLTVKSGKISERNHLNQTSREWAVKMFVCIGIIEMVKDAVLGEVIGLKVNEVNGQVSEVNGHENGSIHDEYAKCEKTCSILRRKTVEIKEMVAAIEDSANDSTKIDTIKKSMDDLESATSDLQIAARSLMHSDHHAQAIERVFGVQDFQAMQCVWASKAFDVFSAIEELTINYFLPLDDLETVTPLDTWSDNFKTVKRKILDVLQSCTNLKLKAKVREQVNNLSDQTDTVYMAMKDLWSNGETLMEKRKWACHAFAMEQSLNDESFAIRRAVVSEAISMLKCQIKEPVVGHTELKSTPDLGFKTSTPASEWRGKPTHFGPVAIDGFSGSKVTYKELKKGPQVTHHTPQPPTKKSGYKPMSKRLLSDRPSTSKLQPEVDKWDEENNAIVRVAKEMTQQLYEMTQFFKCPDDAKSPNKDELIKTAKAIAENGQKLVQFAKILATYCVDKRFSSDLLFYAEHVPCIATQLNILASVRAATPDDRTSEKMLVQNSENLISAIGRMLRAAEATSVKGFNTPPENAKDDLEAVVLATEWNKKYANHRALQTSRAEMDELGLRRVDLSDRAPTLTQFIEKN